MDTIQFLGDSAAEMASCIVMLLSVNGENVSLQWVRKGEEINIVT